MSGLLKMLGESAESSAKKGKAAEQTWSGDINALKEQARARARAGGRGRGAPASPPYYEKDADRSVAPPVARPASPVTPEMSSRMREIHERRAAPAEGINPRREAQRDMAAAERKLAYADAMDERPREFEYFADLDKLKGFNDTFGMPYGDAYIASAENSLRRNLGKVPEANPLFTRAAGDEFYVSGDEPALIESALQLVSRDLNRGVTVDRGPLGRHTVAGVGSLKFGRGRNLDEADAALRGDKETWKDIDSRTGRRHGDARSDMSEAQHLYEYEDPELDWQHIGFKRGGLATIGNYLEAYESGVRPAAVMSLAEKYPEAFDGEYEDGDELIDEDEEYQYYRCGGQVEGYLFGGLKKAAKKVGKGIKKVAKATSKLAPVIGMVPGVGTLAAGAIGGLSGLIAEGNLKGALSGALSGASGGIGGGLTSKLGGSMLAQLAGSAASSVMQSAAQKLSADPSGKSLNAQELAALQQQSKMSLPQQPAQPATVGPMANAADQRASALQAVNQTPANQFAMNYQPAAAPPPVAPGSQSQGLLSRIKSQRAESN